MSSYSSVRSIAAAIAFAVISSSLATRPERRHGVVGLHHRSCARSRISISTITGSGNSLVLTRVPVVSSTRVVSYHNLTLQFDVSSSCVFTLAGGYPQSLLSPIPIPSNFRPGKYVGPSDIQSGQITLKSAAPAFYSAERRSGRSVLPAARGAAPTRRVAPGTLAPLQTALSLLASSKPA